MATDTTPVIVGVGQFVERLDDPGYVGLSPADIAARAAESAIRDASPDGSVSARIGIVGAIRTFDDSMPYPSPFGKPDKYPLAVARRLGIDPAVAIFEKAGGQSPLTLIADLAARISAGETEAALAFGSEAISTMRHLSGAGETRDWNEKLDGVLEDHGRGLEGIVTRYNVDHGLSGAPPAYGLLENARRRRLGLSRDEYLREMGRLFAPFAAVAAANPYSSAADGPKSIEDIITVTARNRMVADPYPLKLVSRDQVNQGAAVLLMSVGAARALGVPEGQWVYIHGCALATERDILERPDLGAAPAAGAALASALETAGKTASDMSFFDFYSCFPIAVFATAIDGLGLSPDDPRGLTVTGGLPYFGGPGNNYSMHAFAAMAERLRTRPGAFGLVAANGGFISKYGVAILSTEPADWRPCVTKKIQERLDEAPRPRAVRHADGWGEILSYTITYGKGAPVLATIAGALDSGERFLASNADGATLTRMVDEDPLGQRIFVKSVAAGNRFAFDRDTIDRAFPQLRPKFRETYNTVRIERRDRVLEVTINRPDQRNCLSKEANNELSDIFDAYEADPELWVAIITGAGDRAFCAGADLKDAATGGPFMPRTGFAGLTSRQRSKPIIAAVNGLAYGGGLETCLASDLVVADPSAKFALTEVKVGVIAGAGGTARLPRQLPRKIAMELLLTGRALDVEEARAFGFVNRVSKPGEVLAEARRLAQEILAVSPTSVRLTMQIVRDGEQYASQDAAAAASLESSAIDAMFASEDMIEGMSAFAEKRSPQWKNR